MTIIDKMKLRFYGSIYIAGDELLSQVAYKNQISKNVIWVKNLVNELNVRIS